MHAKCVADFIQIPMQPSWEEARGCLCVTPITWEGVTYYLPSDRRELINIGDDGGGTRNHLEEGRFCIYGKEEEGKEEKEVGKG